MTLRYGDTDRQGHINNAAYCTLLESGRVDFLFYEDGSHIAGEGKSFVIVKLTVDYLQEMNFPGTVDVGSRIISIGSSSFTVGQGIFMKDTCYSTAESVIVLLDEQTRRSTPLPQHVIQVLQKIM